MSDILEKVKLILGKVDEDDSDKKEYEESNTKIKK